MHPLTFGASTLGATAQAAYELWRNWPEYESIPFALDGYARSVGKFHLRSQFSWNHELSFRADL